MFKQRTTDNIQLDKICKALFGQQFFGVFARDGQLPPMTQTGFYICNLEPANEGGTHWVCILRDITRPYIEYFDSYGLPPDNVHKRRGMVISHNDHRIQPFQSSACGYYCIKYAYDRLKRGLSQYDALYRDYDLADQNVNEAVIERFIKKIRPLAGGHIPRSSLKSNAPGLV